jgi:hypothetical protein
MRSASSTRGLTRRGTSILFAILLVASLAAPAGAATTITNGGFETPDVTTSQKWNVYPNGTTDLGWTVAWADDYTDAPTTANLELHAGVNGWLPYAGDQYAELDTDWDGPTGPLTGEEASVRISQTIDTMVGGMYRLGYAWSPRPGHADNAISVEVGGVEVDSHSASGVGNANTVWTPEEQSFTATGLSTEIAFEETGTPDSLGMFLDAVTFCRIGFTSTLFADQDIPVGEVIVWDDGDNVYVQYVMDDPWVLHETHVEVVDDPAYFPTTRSGNPQIGLFSQGDTFVPGVSESPIYTFDVTTFDDEVFVAAHAVVWMLAGEGLTAPTWATTVDYYEQGTTKSGGAVLADRTDPEAALEPGGYFYALGLDNPLTTDTDETGFLVVSWDHPIYNGPGDDLQINEVTNGRSTYPVELADVYAYYDGAWHLIGQATNKATAGVNTFDLGSLPYATAIKLVDATNAALHNSLADGFDVDGIGAAYTIAQMESAWGDTAGIPFVVDGGSWAMYFPYIMSDCPLE